MGFSSIDEVIKKRDLRRDDPLSTISTINTFQQFFDTYRKGIFKGHFEILSFHDTSVKIRFDSSVYADRFRKEEYAIRQKLQFAKLTVIYVVGTL